MLISWHPEGFWQLFQGVLNGLPTTRFPLAIMALLYVMKGEKLNGHPPKYIDCSGIRTYNQTIH